MEWQRGAGEAVLERGPVGVPGGAGVDGGYATVPPQGELEGLTPPKNFRTVSFLDKNIVPFGTRSAVGRRRGAVDWDHTKLDVSSDAAIFDLITANEYKASCWVSVKCALQ